MSARPAAIDRQSSAAGLRTIAVFEAAKGLLVLALGVGALTMLHKDLEQAVEGILLHLHVNPDRRVGHAILNAASRMTDGSLWGIAAAAVAYASVRFTEAWGLWHRRVWAEWFALLSGMLYLPWEIVKIVEKPNRIHFVMLLGNLIILAYMAHVRFVGGLSDWRAKRQSAGSRDTKSVGGARPACSSVQNLSG